MTTILCGCDPEIFMFKDGKPVSAHGAVQGDKKNPQPVPFGAVQVDGMALEFNINPASTSKEFVTNIQQVMKALAEMVPGYELKAIPVAEFGAEYMANQPMEAKELGCEPDFNAYTDGAVNPRPDGEVTFRTGAGHVHIGWDKDIDIQDPVHLEACIMAVKQMDVFLGLPSLIFDNTAESVKRRKLYGKAGAFRPKSYGVEYRTLSNTWLSSPELMAYVCEQTQEGIQRLLDGKAVYQGTYADDIINNRKGADQIRHAAYYMEKHGIKCPPGYRFHPRGYEHGFLKEA